MIFGINNENIPVALVQGSLDGVGTPDEADAAIKVLDRPSELIPIPGANHCDITDVNNPQALSGFSSTSHSAGGVQLIAFEAASRFVGRCLPSTQAHCNR